MINKRIITFGLTEKENEKVFTQMPAKDYELLDTDCFTDVLAVPATAILINTEQTETEDLEMLCQYYLDIECCTDETVIWIGSTQVPSGLKSFIKVYPDFEALDETLKYVLLSAHRKTKNAEGHSRMLADSLLILSLIRKFPGITTAQIVERTEISLRSVQRYIKSIQATGEWLTYNRTIRGWELQDGKSLLFGDVWEK